MKLRNNKIYFYGLVDFLSPLHIANFTVNGVIFINFDQYIYYQKCLFFKDIERANEIIKTKNINRILLIGRRIRGVNEDEWAKVFEDTAYAGIYEKFKQVPTLISRLMATTGNELVNVSPYDTFWGTGPIKPGEVFEGENNYGKILMKVRSTFLNN